MLDIDEGESGTSCMISSLHLVQSCIYGMQNMHRFCVQLEENGWRNPPTGQVKETLSDLVGIRSKLADMLIEARDMERTEAEGF